MVPPAGEECRLLGHGSCSLTHDDLVAAAGRWLRNTAACSVVLEELVANTGNGEKPDAIGWYTGHTLLIECKASRADFLADHKKRFRMHPERGMGMFRYFMAPAGLIKPSELPSQWGLLEVTGQRVSVSAGYRPRTIVRPESPWAFPDRYVDGETQMLLSAMVRVKASVGQAAFNSMLHTRLMKPAPQKQPDARDMTAWATFIHTDAQGSPTEQV